jgi:subtilase family serine protease
MKAYLILKPAGEAGRDELPTAANIKKRLASADTVRKAEDAARSLGFTVVSTTPLQVTIEGDKEQFEKAFSSKLKSASRKRAGSKKAPGKKESIAAADLWTWESSPAVPAELGDAVQEIVLPQAAALH